MDLITGIFLQSASFGTPLAPPSVFIASRSIMSSSSPTSAFPIVASSPELRLARSLRLLKALENSFPTSLGAIPEVRSLSRYVLDSNRVPSSSLFSLYIQIYSTPMTMDLIYWI